MRIALVCPYSLSRPGGVQGQVRGLAAALTDAGHAVTVLGPDDRYPVGPFPGAATPTMVVGGSTRVRANGSVAPVSLSPATAARARRAVRGGRFDVVHLHEPLAPVTGYGCLHMARQPVVATFHRSGVGMAYRVAGAVAGGLVRGLDARVAVSDAAGETLRRALKADCEVLFNGADLARFSGAVPTPREGTTLVFVGRHEQRKGLAVLLAAFDRVREPATLWVVGDGPDSTELRRRHPESARLRWLGALDDAAVASRLAGADVLCAPSLGGESFGVVLLEAMAAGTAVLASNIAGYRASSAGYATFVRAGDVGAWSSAVARAIRSAAARSGGSSVEAIERAAGWAEQHSMTRLAERYLAIYDRVVHR
jgi:phosphatidylinositol alpha-mannosyltransferase